MCFREEDGKFLWQYVSERLTPIELDWPFSGIHCAPLVEGDRLWFTTNRCEVVCLDIRPLRLGKGDPRPVWKLDMRKQLGVHPVSSLMNWGLTCSIGAPYKGRIYVITGNGVDEENGTVPAPEAPSLLCLDKNDGKVLWKDHSPARNILHGQWSSPLVVEVKGRGQVITPQGDGWVRSFDALTGKLLWKLDTNPKASEGKPLPRRLRNSLLATPVFHQGLVYIANGRPPELGSTWGRLYCIDPTREGDISPELEDGPGKVKPNRNSGALWCFDGYGDGPDDRMHGSFANVAVHDGLVIAPDEAGFIHCLDARTGRRHWVHDVKENITSSPLIVDGKVYVADDGGDVTVLALSRRKKVIAVNPLDDSVRAPPVFANGVLYIASRWKLYAIKSGGPTGRGPDRAPGHWPQWRGPHRDNVSRDKGLLTEWPRGGPPLLWKAGDLGEGVPSVAVAGGKVFVLGYRDGKEFLTALGESDGKRAWSVPVGPAEKEISSMRWLSQRTPTVDGDRVYAFTARGQLICLATADGKERWRKDYVKDFGGNRSYWGYCDFPLVDGDRLICTPGGKEATLAALDKKTGAVVWKCVVPQTPRAAHGGLVAARIAGVRQYLHQLDTGVVAVSADGKLLWHYPDLASFTGNVHTALVTGDEAFVSCGWGRGAALLKISSDGTALKAEAVWRKTLPFDSWLGSSVRLDKYVHAANGFGAEWATGSRLEGLGGKGVLRGGRGTMTCADGRLIYRSGNNLVSLVEVTGDGRYVKRGEFQGPRNQTREPTWSFPVVAGGRLYLRDQDVLLCYDLKAKKKEPSRPVQGKGPNRREPDVIFVPTPQDVVEKMLEAAGVKKGDVVADLGCGDGRIVITAAARYGCRAVGYDLDPECVRLARAGVQKAGVATLVRIERADIFAVDLRGVTVVALYLGPKLNARLAPQLAKMKPGSRVVSHAFAMPGYRPDKVIAFTSAEDDVAHKIYLWTIPLKKEGDRN
jgi:outer membrane protein assembly factor BamB